MSARLPTWAKLSPAQQNGCLQLAQGSLGPNPLGAWCRAPGQRPVVTAATGAALTKLLLARVLGGRLHATEFGLKLIPAQCYLPL